MGTNNAINNDDPVDVLLICALKDEYDQVREVTDGIVEPGWQEHQNTNGWIVADACFTTASRMPLSIRTTHASHIGREQAQALASDLIHHQSAHCIAMSGICAGRRDKLALGDVIFADRLWSYDHGKITVENGEQRFQGDMLQYRPPQHFVQRMQHVAYQNSPWLQQRPILPLEDQEHWVLLRLFTNDDPRQHADFKTACPNWSDVLPRLWKRQWLEQDSLTLTTAGQQQANRLKLLHPESLPAPPDFQIHVAPIATGAAVTEDAGIFPRLAESMRKVLGVEMEASALGALGEALGVPVLIAKGVSDYGDAFKDDRYRRFAARASAECLIALLRNSVDLLPNRSGCHQESGNHNTRPLVSGNGRSSAPMPLEKAATLLQKLLDSPPAGIDIHAICRTVLPPELLNRPAGIADGAMHQCLLDRPQFLLDFFAAVAEAPHGPAMQAELQAISAAIAAEFSLVKSTSPAPMPQAADAAPPALLIEIQEAASQSDRCNVKVRLFKPDGSIGCVDDRQLCIHETQEQKQFVDVLRTILVRNNIGTKRVIIEFALPITLFCHDIEHWADQVDEPLGTQFPVVLRSLERMYQPSWQLEWPAHWQALRAEFTTLLDKDNFKTRLYWPKNKAEISGKLKTGVCVAFDAVPDPHAQRAQNLLFHLLYKGAPAVLWARRDVRIRRLKAELKKHLHNKPFGQLPGILRDVRKQLHGQCKKDSVCYHLSLLWDDPTRVPPPRQDDDDFYLAPN